MFSDTRSRVRPTEVRDAVGEDPRANLRARFGQSPAPTQNPRFHPVSRRTSSLPPSLAGSFLSAGSLSDSAMSISSAGSAGRRSSPPPAPVSPMSISQSPVFQTPTNEFDSSRVPTPRTPVSTTFPPTPRTTPEPERVPTPRQPVVPQPTGIPAAKSSEPATERPSTPELPTMWGRAERVDVSTHLSWQFVQSRLSGKSNFPVFINPQCFWIKLLQNFISDIANMALVKLFEFVSNYDIKLVFFLKQIF